MKRIRNMPVPDRPREKLRRRGPQALSETELWALILGSGTKQRPVMKLAATLDGILNEADENPTVAELRKKVGLGQAQASRIMAVRELMRRRLPTKASVIGRTEDCLPLVAFIARKPQEHLVCLSLNGAGEVLACRVVTIGLADGTLIHPREVFADPLKDRAAAIIIAHNHPSGRCAPSRRDRTLTRRLRQAADLLGLRLIDHLILAGDQYYSFRKRGLL